MPKQELNVERVVEAYLDENSFVPEGKTTPITYQRINYVWDLPGGGKYIHTISIKKELKAVIEMASSAK